MCYPGIRKKYSDAIVNGNVGYSDHEMTELEIQRAERKTSSRVIVLDFREVNSVLFRVLFGGSPWEAALRGMGAGAGCLYKGILSTMQTHAQA